MRVCVYVCACVCVCVSVWSFCRLVCSVFLAVLVVGVDGGAIASKFVTHCWGCPGSLFPPLGLAGGRDSHNRAVRRQPYRTRTNQHFKPPLLLQDALGTIVP